MDRYFLTDSADSADSAGPQAGGDNSQSPPAPGPAVAGPGPWPALLLSGENNCRERPGSGRSVCLAGQTRAGTPTRARQAETPRSSGQSVATL